MLYLFKCPECQGVVEEYQPAKNSHALSGMCPNCSYEGDFKRVFTAPQIVYKGRGWPVKEQWLEKEAKVAQDAADGYYNQPPKNPLSDNDDFFQQACEKGLDQHKAPVFGDAGAVSKKVEKPAEAVAA